MCEVLKIYFLSETSIVLTLKNKLIQELKGFLISLTYDFGVSEGNQRDVSRLLFRVGQNIYKIYHT